MLHLGQKTPTGLSRWVCVAGWRHHTRRKYRYKAFGGGKGDVGVSSTVCHLVLRNPTKSHRQLGDLHVVSSWLTSRGPFLCAEITVKKEVVASRRGERVLGGVCGKKPGEFFWKIPPVRFLIGGGVSWGSPYNEFQMLRRSLKSTDPNLEKRLVPLNPRRPPSLSSQWAKTEIPQRQTKKKSHSSQGVNSCLWQHHNNDNGVTQQPSASRCRCPLTAALLPPGGQTCLNIPETDSLGTLAGRQVSSTTELVIGF